jgi:hypothetical protein
VRPESYSNANRDVDQGKGRKRMSTDKKRKSGLTVTARETTGGDTDYPPKSGLTTMTESGGCEGPEPDRDFSSKTRLGHGRRETSKGDTDHPPKTGDRDVTEKK